MAFVRDEMTRFTIASREGNTTLPASRVEPMTGAPVLRVGAAAVDEPLTNGEA